MYVYSKLFARINHSIVASHTFYFRYAFKITQGLGGSMS